MITLQQIQALLTPKNTVHNDEVRRDGLNYGLWQSGLRIDEYGNAVPIEDTDESGFRSDKLAGSSATPSETT